MSTKIKNRAGTTVVENAEGEGSTVLASQIETGTFFQGTVGAHRGIFVRGYNTIEFIACGNVGPFEDSFSVDKTLEVSDYRPFKKTRLILK